jgi:putative Mn2+ efflux pump MntP
LLAHEILILVVFAIAANLDNLGVGIAYGLRRERISSRSNLVIAIMSIGLTFIAMKFGQWIQPILSVKVANDLGASVIIVVGIWVFFEVAIQRIWSILWRHLWRYVLRKIRVKRQIDRPKTKPNLNALMRFLNKKNPNGISVFETLILGVSLSLNAMAGGFGASLAGHNAIATSIAVGMFSYVMIAVGQSLADNYASKWLGSFSQRLAGFLLMAIGIYELLF